MFLSKNYKKIFALLLMLGLTVTMYNCKKKKEDTVVETVDKDYVESPVSGRLTLPVDESIFPVVEDVSIVFEKEYNRVKLDLVPKSEKEILHLLLTDSLRTAVMTRQLNEEEKQHYEGAVVPKITYFGRDAIVFVTSKVSSDSIIDYTNILDLIKTNKLNESDSFLVFDNPNSSIVSDFKRLTGFDSFPKDYAYFLNNTKEVVDYVASNPKAIGVIGLNWLTQPDKSLETSIGKVKVLAVKNMTDNRYYKPSQNNIAESLYPLTRMLYVWDFSGKNGLGLGFASYIAGYKGQRIILNSGLCPFMAPQREIVVTKEIKK